MACIDSSGTLMPTARMVLKTLRQAHNPAEVAKLTGLPTYRVRASLRELVEMGLLAQDEGVYRITPAGEQKLGASA